MCLREIMLINYLSGAEFQPAGSGSVRFDVADKQVVLRLGCVPALRKKPYRKGSLWDQ